MKNKIIGIIPARYNSKRFLGKLLYKINSKTLLQHTYENAKSCDFFDELYIATEDEAIKTEANKIKAKCIMTKKCSSGTNRIIEAFKNNFELQNSEILVNIQGDHPKISSNTINQIINILKNDKTAVCSTAVIKTNYEIASLSNHVKCVFDNNKNALYFSRALIPYSKNPNKINYYYHIGVYAYKTSFLYEFANLKNTKLEKTENLEQLKILEHGYKMKITIVDDMPISVDIFEDIKRVEKVLCQ